jgi:hypothetical protein
MKNSTLCILLLFGLLGSIVTLQGKIRLYAIYTPSHERMMREYFLPSIQDDFELILDSYSQECQSGNFMQSGWNKTMLHKVEILIRGIRENWGEIFIHSDVDIQFFRPALPEILQAMKGKDVVCQQDRPEGNLCAGFIVCRGNEKTLRLWQDIYNALLNAGSGANDQTLLNHLINRNRSLQDSNKLIRLLLNFFLRKSYRGNNYKIAWGYLPKTFMGGGTFTGALWKPGKYLPVPSDIIMHHANFCVGTDQKIAQLEYVKKIVKGRKK